jgi:hypothetical protein
MKKYFTILMALALVTALVSGCAIPGVSSPTLTPPSGQAAAGGTLEIRVTDAPRTDNVTEIWVKVSEVEIHKATTEQEQDQNTDNDSQEQDEDGDGEWLSANITGPNPFELLALKDGGIQQVLASANLTAGKYTQIRMTVEQIQVRLGTGDNITAKLPSSKLKFVQPFEVKDWNTTVLLFDFDAEKLVKVNYTGADKEPKIIVTPVIKLTVEKPKPTEAVVKITTPSLPNGAVGASYNATLQASGGLVPYTWNIASGTLPPGLWLTSAGVLGGTPITAADYTFTAKVSDNSTPANINTKQYTVTIAAGETLIITTTSLPDGKEGQLYSATIFAIGGTAPYGWTASAGSLPDGLNLNSATGVLSGTPSKNGQFNFTVQVSDNSTTMQTDTQPLSIRIAKN